MRHVFARLLNRAELSGDGLCPPYLVKYRLLSTPWGGIYLHHFLADDWSLDLHDHPYAMISIGLRGGYREELAHGVMHVWRAPWFHYFPAVHAHRIRLLPGRSCWTLIVSLRGNRPWGFLTPRGWIPAADYFTTPDLPRRSC